MKFYVHLARGYGSVLL